MKAERVEHMAGGNGHALIRHILGKEELKDKGRLYAEVTLEPGCTLGFHEHHGESETYYLLTGEGIYQDNDKEYPVKAGDVTFCDDGNGHGLKNTGDSDLKFIALILKK